MMRHSLLMVAGRLVLACAWLGGAATFGAGPRIAAICTTGGANFVKTPQARDKLAEALGQAGYTVKRLALPQEWAQALDDPATALVIYEPCETVPEAMAAKIKPFLNRGGIFITGGGMPLWYVVDPAGRQLRSGGGVQRELAAFEGGFIPEDKVAPLSGCGKRILGREAGVPSGSRGITAADDGHDLIPLASLGGIHPAAVVYFPNNGKFLFVSTLPLERGAFNPLDGAQVWRRLLAFLAAPLPKVTVTVAKDEWISGQDQTIAAAVVLDNPHAQPITLTYQAVVSKEPLFGITRDPMLVLEKKLTLAPKARVESALSIPMPPAPAWGVYRLEFVSDLGLKSSCCFQVLPPAAIAYLDLDPIYPANPADTRTVTVGIRSFLGRYPTRVLVEAQPAAGGAWTAVAEKKLEVRRTPQSNITTFAFSLAPKQGEDLRLKASIVADDGVIHTSFNRLEYADHNRALDRRPTMFRALDGSQFAVDSTAIAVTNNLLQWRREMPLFRGVMVFQLPGTSRDWLRQNDFTCNYGQIITNFPMLAEWKLDDCNGAGVSALKYMPAHAEDVTSWLVRQHSRAYFQHYLDDKPDIVNLVEAVAGYEPPGADPNRDGHYSHFLGYTPRAIPNYREALAGRDEGVRMLDPGGRTMRRYSFKEMYELTYDEALPAPQALGFASWDGYIPYKSTSRNEGGFFGSKAEELKCRIHYYLRNYSHLKQLDDLSVNLRAFAPEIHCVIGGDGPLLGQLSSQYYRLPYIDTNTRWLFRSAYIQARSVTYGGERTWLETAARFGRRVGLHEEIGAGQWAPYRTAETSFVSLFTKRAALPYPDLQVDFFHTLAKTSRLAEEKAMYKGFQMAVDTQATPCTAGAEILMVYNNNSYYPDNARGNYRWDLKNPEHRILTLGDFTWRAGIPAHAIETPLWDTQLLANYRIVCLAAERYMKGDLPVVQAWLRDRQAKGRILFINHASPLQVNYLNGPEIQEIQWRSQNGWGELGLAWEQPVLTPVNTLRVMGKAAYSPVHPLPCLVVPPPPDAKPLVESENGVPVVWQLAIGANSVIYSGLPLGNISVAGDPDAVCYKVMSDLFASLGCPPVCKAVPEDWFACGYRLNGNRLAIALINPKEEKIAMDGPYGDDGDKVEQVAAAVGVTEVEVTWNKAGVPQRTYKVRDAWNNTLLDQVVKADAAGTIRAKLKINVAKLLILE